MGPSSSRFTPSWTASPGVLVALNETCGKDASLDAHAPNAFMIASFAAGVAFASVGSIVMVKAGDDQSSSAPDDVFLRPALPDATFSTALCLTCEWDVQTAAPATAVN